MFPWTHSALYLLDIWVAMAPSEHITDLGECCWLSYKTPQPFTANSYSGDVYPQLDQWASSRCLHSLASNLFLRSISVLIWFLWTWHWWDDSIPVTLTRVPVRINENVWCWPWGADPGFHFGEGTSQHLPCLRLQPTLMFLKYSLFHYKFGQVWEGLSAVGAQNWDPNTLVGQV